MHSQRKTQVHTHMRPYIMIAPSLTHVYKVMIWSSTPIQEHIHTLPTAGLADQTQMGTLVHD